MLALYAVAASLGGLVIRGRFRHNATEATVSSGADYKTVVVTGTWVCRRGDDLPRQVTDLIRGLLTKTPPDRNVARCPKCGSELSVGELDVGRAGRVETIPGRFECPNGCDLSGT